MAIAVVFPGQSSQYPRMGQAILEEQPDLRKYYEMASDILHKDISQAIFCEESNFLTEKEDIQPAVFLTSYVYYQYLLNKKKLSVNFYAGHSLGEITALVASGMLSFEDGLSLVKKRSELMTSAANEQPSSMLSVSQLNQEVLTEYCEKHPDLYCACYNSPVQTVLAGSEKQIAEAFSYFEGLGGKVRALSTTGACHTPYMQSASKELGNYLEQLQFHEPSAPVISNVTGRPYARERDIRTLLQLQLVQAVQWERTISYLESRYVTDICECGPGATLTNLLRKRKNKLAMYSIDREGIPELPVTHEKMPYRYQTLVTLCEKTAVCCKNRTENLRVDLCEDAYHKLNAMQLNSTMLYQEGDVNEAFTYLTIILHEKGYQEPEIQKKKDEICEELGFIIGK